jgi:PAS domain S-box-containing protein
MNDKPTYEELEQRIRDLEQQLARHQESCTDARRNEQYLKAILDNANLPLYLKDADYRYLLINPEFARLARVTATQIQGLDDFAVFPEPVARLFREQDEEVKRRNTLVEFKETIILADGEHVFLTAKFPLHDPAGTIYAIGGVCTDITRQQRIEDALRESERSYSSFIENFHGIAFRCDLLTLTPVYFRGKVEEITGYREEEILAGRPRPDQIVHPDDLHWLLEEKEKRYCPGYAFRHEFRIIRKDGDERWVLKIGKVLGDAQDRPALVEGSLFDITRRKNAEKALQESEERYRSLVETASQGIVISNLEGRIILSNPAHRRIHELADDEDLGRYVWDFVEGGEEKKNLQEYYRQIIAEQPRPEPYYAVNRTVSGRTVQYQVDWNYMRDSEGRVYALCSVVTDTTARDRAEQALRESEQKLKNVIDSYPEGILLYTLHPDGSLIFTGANPAANTILQLDCSLFIGSSIEKAFPGLSETEIPERFRDICRHGGSWQTEEISYADQRVEGTYRVHAFQTGPHRMAAFFQDVTLKQRMEKELQKIQKLESLGILAGGIAHDFNNLLTAILGNVSMAKLFALTDQAKVLDRLTDAEKASLRARDLTQQLLTFAKGGAPVKCAADLGEIIRDSTSFMLSGSNVRREILLPADLWPVEIDAGQISQVIQNVVKNSDQAMPEGGTITILAVNVLVEAGNGLPLQPGNYVHLSIADQGVGIPKKYLSRIFDPYFSTKQEGSGLGLAACHSIIKNHDGLIFAESEFGAGATFHIYLPASENNPPPKAASRKPPQSSGESILIMDDDDDVLDVAVNMLTLMGYRTAIAHDGAEAIAMYKQAMESGRPFDGVLLDLTIPGGLGGRDTVKQLAILDPEVKAIVSSGYANDPIMADYAAYGFKGVASKPYDMELLGNVIRELFG